MYIYIQMQGVLSQRNRIQSVIKFISMKKRNEFDLLKSMKGLNSPTILHESTGTGISSSSTQLSDKYFLKCNLRQKMKKFQRISEIIPNDQKQQLRFLQDMCEKAADFLIQLLDSQIVLLPPHPRHNLTMSFLDTLFSAALHGLRV